MVRAIVRIYLREVCHHVALFDRPRRDYSVLPQTPRAQKRLHSTRLGRNRFFLFKGCDALLGAQNHTPSGWLPAAQNIPSIHAIIFTGGLIVTIQSAIASTHDINDIGFKLIAQAFTKAPGYFHSLQWRHIFITHSDENAQQLRRQSLPGLESRRILVYSAVLNPANLRLTPQKLNNAQRIRVRRC